jgi:hypothetical protein
LYHCPELKIKQMTKEQFLRGNLFINNGIGYYFESGKLYKVGSTQSECLGGVVMMPNEDILIWDINKQLTEWLTLSLKMCKQLKAVQI